MQSRQGWFICRECRRSLPRLLPRARRTYATIEHATRPTAIPRGLRLGIVGSGPAGFYAAARVLQKLSDARVDMYERLPVPFGLVRYGVAPDHPEVKNCQDRFEEVAMSERFQFVGNTSIGYDIPLETLRTHYDALLFAYGASEDRLLGVPGEELQGVYSAREFVGWYNSLPEFAHLEPDLSGDHAVVIGNGNVALDVARILLTDVDMLRKTDISDHALDALSRSRVRKVTIAGRRGPMQAAFTIKELRELISLPNASFTCENVDLLPSDAWIKTLPKLEQRKYRFVKLLAAGSANGTSRHCSLLSLVSPQSLSGGRDGKLSQAHFRLNDFVDPENLYEAQARVKNRNETLTLDTSLVFRSIGYRSQPLPDMDTALGIDFEKSRGIIQNDGLGRALSIENLIKGAENPVAQHILRGCYCSGWVKNGPTGVIASTMDDAFTTADAIVKDWEANETFLNGKPSERLPDSASGWDGLRDRVKLNDSIAWEDWRAIDAVEKSRVREGSGRPRSKLTSVADMLAAAAAAASSKASV